MRIVFTGGGSGGHFFPILEVIREIKKIAEEELILDLELYYIGPNDSINGSISWNDYLMQEGITPIYIGSGKLRRYFSLSNFTDFFKTITAIFRTFWNMFLIMPDVVFSKGGYGAFPTILSAIILRIPLIIHESDSIPGKVNKFSAGFAKKIGVAFISAYDYFPKEKTALVGIPIRKRILGGSAEEAKEHFDIFTNVPVIGVLGGSQGSQIINETIIKGLKDITEKWELIHQTGIANFQAIKEEASVILEFSHKERYHPYGFLDEQQLRDFSKACDIIVSRAGATAIFEISAWGKPSILVPLRSSAQDHQKKNAYEYAATGAASVIEETNFTPHILMAEIEDILKNKMRIMSESAQKFSRIDSAEIISREILKAGIH